MYIYVLNTILNVTIMQVHKDLSSNKLMFLIHIVKYLAKMSLSAPKFHMEFPTHLTMNSLDKLSN